MYLFKYINHDIVIEQNFIFLKNFLFSFVSIKCQYLGIQYSRDRKTKEIEKKNPHPHTNYLKKIKKKQTVYTIVYRN